MSRLLLFSAMAHAAQAESTELEVVTLVCTNGSISAVPISPEIQAMFDTLPRQIKLAILTKKGLVERFIAKRTEDVHRKMAQYLENKCREL